MENVKIISDNGVEKNVSGLFYVFNSKYYFIYTEKELDEKGYVQLYVVQVCKEIQNTPTGPIDTGYMLGMEISNPEEWANVQKSITRIVEDKKNNIQSPEIQYLPINMLANLKITGRNKFKLMNNIIKEHFGLLLENNSIQDEIKNNEIPSFENQNLSNDVPKPIEPVIQNPSVVPNTTPSGDVIIDYRARFFEEQEKNKELEEQLKNLNEKLNNIKSLIG